MHLAPIPWYPGPTIQCCTKMGIGLRGEGGDVTNTIKNIFLIQSVSGLLSLIVIFLIPDPVNPYCHYKTENTNNNKILANMNKYSKTVIPLKVKSVYRTSEFLNVTANSTACFFNNAL